MVRNDRRVSIRRGCAGERSPVVFIVGIGVTTLREPPPSWTHPLRHGLPPTWASAWGDDRLHGPWCAIEVNGVAQRLRWVFPGTFRMGSPEDEDGRYSDEGPRQLVTIDSGFWIFDTPCTQAFWQAVTGANPSHFQNADRPKETAKHPVESVSWEDCQEFLKALNARLDGLQLALPSEAQWEYACRAGTETARYGDDVDRIAWYSKNSDGKTHPVAAKDANSWGLYDMLGNVWEWCADAWVADYSEKSRASASARRVFRGGSWYDVALLVRAACRALSEPSFRDRILGFRCAEFRPGWLCPANAVCPMNRAAAQ